MQQVILPGTSLTVSRFIFGTGSMFGRSAADRSALFAAAVDAGFTHFDTAPYYGFGLMERDLAPVLAAHRHVTVTTKVALYSPGGEVQQAWQIMARKAAGRIMPVLSRPIADLNVARARASLNASLKRLGRDHIEALLLHEPELGLLDTDEWLRFLEDSRLAGKIGLFGLAAGPARLAAFIAADHPLLAFVQAMDSLDAREADMLTATGRPLQISYGYLRAAFADAGSALPDAQDILARALRRNDRGAIIVNTTNPQRLAQYAHVADTHHH